MVHQQARLERERERERERARGMESEEAIERRSKLPIPTLSIRIVFCYKYSSYAILACTLELYGTALSPILIVHVSTSGIGDSLRPSVRFAMRIAVLRP
mmetsp:Transcript_5030/g.13383  ORF Transcript_5030/g.13383 Transcript_5030/m.13383 type:complete len:99 (+) Transcript_5030:384-680(+)